MTENPLILLAREKREAEEAKKGKSLVPRRPTEYIKFMVRLMKSKETGPRRPRSGVYRMNPWGQGTGERRVGEEADTLGSLTARRASLNLEGVRSWTPGTRARRLASLIVRNKPSRPMARSEGDVNWTLPAGSPEDISSATPGAVTVIQVGQVDPSRWHFTRVEGRRKSQ
jgi:hypothetical protein